VPPTDLRELADAALNPRGDVTPDGVLSISEAVTIVYREGRNKLAHGEVPGLFEDLSNPRVIGDDLLCGLFDVTTTELGKLIASGDKIFTVPEKHAYRALMEKLRKRV
jgi:hypothetical protein